MTELKTLGSFRARQAIGCCQAELMALRYMRGAVRAYPGKKVDPSLFAPLVRNIFDEQCVFDLRNRLTHQAEEVAGEAPGEDWEGSRRCGARDAFCDLWCNPMTRDECRRQILEWTDQIISEYEGLSADDPLLGRFAEIEKLMHLTPDERRLLEVLWLLSIEKLEEVVTPYAISQTTGFLSLYCGLGEQQIRYLMRDSSRLNRFGCIQRSGRGCCIHAKIRYFLDGLSDEPLASSFYWRDENEVLPTAFFGSLATDHLPLLKRLLTGAKGRKLNILLYGAPGTGKTSFARVLAHETGRIAYQVQQRPKDKRGDFCEAKAEIRYAALEICDEQTESDSSLIIVDEADALLRCNNPGLSELLGGLSTTTGDKGLLNDLLDRIETPTVWITNTDAAELDSSNRRRFDYAIRFDPLTREQRLQIWRNAVSRTDFSERLEETDLQRLSDDYPVSAGVIARALENVKRMDATKEETVTALRCLLDRQCELSGTPPASEAALLPTKGYSIEGLNIRSSIPLAKVETAVRRFLDDSTRAADLDAPRMNILLSGVPGSGKTEFVKHLAASLGRPLLMRRASDLKSKWVGETERNIAAAFRMARAKRAILFLDEIDTFLDDREAVGAGHEKSMVNEVLQQMEAFGGVFVGTTNFSDRLDPAVARRFTFKVELDYLDQDGVRLFWRRYFGTEPGEEVCRRLARMDRLTPGDFRTVRQELYYLGGDVDDDDRLEALASELAAKTKRSRPIGFAA